MSDLDVRMTERGNVWRDAQWMTSVPAVFAAGDMQRGQSLIVWAIDDGRRAAAAIEISRTTSWPIRSAACASAGYGRSDELPGRLRQGCCVRMRFSPDLSSHTPSAVTTRAHASWCDAASLLPLATAKRTGAAASGTTRATTLRRSDRIAARRDASRSVFRAIFVDQRHREVADFTPASSASLNRRGDKKSGIGGDG